MNTQMLLISRDIVVCFFFGGGGDFPRFLRVECRINKLDIFEPSQNTRYIMVDFSYSHLLLSQSLVLRFFNLHRGAYNTTCSLLAAPKKEKRKKAAGNQNKPKARIVIQCVRVIHIIYVRLSYECGHSKKVKEGWFNEQDTDNAVKTRRTHHPPPTSVGIVSDRSTPTLDCCTYVGTYVHFHGANQSKAVIVAGAKKNMIIFSRAYKKKKKKLLTRPPQTKCTYIVRTSLTTLGCFVPRK